MQFGIKENERFGTMNGAWSEVTHREVHDSQITVTEDEKEVMLGHFRNADIHVGHVRDNRELAKKTFNLHGTGRSIGLNLVYPKPEKSELRLYLSERAGFKPEGSEIWFVYVKSGEIFIGSMTKEEWEGASHNPAAFDSEDQLYQAAIQGDPSALEKVERQDSQFPRDSRLPRKVISEADFKCEVDGSHTTFISRSTGSQYMEAHHLVPIAFQGEYQQPLDQDDNIYCLCSVCHDKIHYGVPEDVREIVGKLLKKKGEVLDRLAIDEAGVLAHYGC